MFGLRWRGEWGMLLRMRRGGGMERFGLGVFLVGGCWMLRGGFGGNWDGGLGMMDGLRGLRRSGISGIGQRCLLWSSYEMFYEMDDYYGWRRRCCENDKDSCMAELRSCAGRLRFKFNQSHVQHSLHESIEGQCEIVQEIVLPNINGA